MGNIYCPGTVSFGHSPARDRRIENASLFQLKTWSFFLFCFPTEFCEVTLVICFLPLSLHTSTTLQHCELHTDFVLYRLLLSFILVHNFELSIVGTGVYSSLIHQVYDCLSRMSKQSFCVRLTILFYWTVKAYKIMLFAYWLLLPPISRAGFSSNGGVACDIYYYSYQLPTGLAVVGG